MAVTHDAETGMTTISFEISNDKYKLKDAVVVPTYQYNSMLADDLEVEKQKRFDQWIYNLENPPEAPEQEIETLGEPEA